MRIGVDFDNTIAGYDRLFETLAAELGLLRPGAPSSGAIRGKTAVRDAVRLLPDGENHWQRLQALAYGPRIGGAELLPGVAEFFRRCRDAGLPVAVVSHKTRFAAGGEGETDLREAAIGFLRGHGFFGPAGLGLDEALVFFEPTRRDKVARIRELGCTHFIDDLPEVFAHEDFPQGVERLLLAPPPPAPAATGGALVRRFVDWRGIMGYVFGHAAPHP
jgi:hypothetical protein